MKVFLLALFPLYVLYAGVSSTNIVPSFAKKSFMHIKILDQKKLTYERLYGLKFAELSDVTYDQKTQTHFTF